MHPGNTGSLLWTVRSPQTIPRMPTYASFVSQGLRRGPADFPPAFPILDSLQRYFHVPIASPASELLSPLYQ